MAILDRQNTPSFNQAVTVTANSTDVIDLGISSPGRRIGEGQPLRITARVRTAFAGGTSLRAQYVESAAPGLTSPVVLADSGVVALAALTAGALLLDTYIPGSTGLRYQGFIYTVVGTMTAGNVDGFVNIDTDHQIAYADGYNVLV